MLLSKVGAHQSQMILEVDPPFEREKCIQHAHLPHNSDPLVLFCGSLSHCPFARGGGGYPNIHPPQDDPHDTLMIFNIHN